MSTPALSFEELASAAKPPASTEPKVTPTEPSSKPPEPPASGGDETKPQFTDADVSAYQTMRDLGLTPENAREFIQAKEWLGTISYALQNDPQAFIDELRRTNPQLADKFTEVASDDWFNRKGKYIDVGDNKSKDGKSNTVSSEPDPRIDQLSREVAQLRQANEQEREGKRQAQVEKDFVSAYDTLVDKLPADLPDSTKELISLKAQKAVWQDPQARARVNSGNFTDIPKFFAQASQRVTADIKAAADKEKTARSGVESRGTKEIPHGSDNVAGAAQSQPGQDPIWGNISEQEVVSAYKR